MLDSDHITWIQRELILDELYIRVTLTRQSFTCMIKIIL